ncbi:Protein export cytoplasm protein SecA ATPase RNA helicase [Dehalobacter sp. UNSWDHB]|jgi:preprotein translocase, SecA subunit|uniref:preprotein translocase subunit SecA n=1 Tax=unclassified Dehalobacter TaxID=2635733 RepID=UPI00028B1EA6|nr:MULTISPECIES: preprotein translocase subunit SecA [unclassified Dehalobacter]AFV03881.1 Protein export cytoplasm protein SecA ATPase RNA helicase [Dehalobacter sp. DCA]AFV06859.1 Protein export cytoplasm protein SecA ATPase RNA helicase [Dehalobacter sp. CF]EQB21401.1 Protein export cytoplasm protein SecA ATPase RNA helicase [Dehalobacter sp. UNSWDHB]MCG1024678.1 preprotein translocase subunit SecA [Dehalobacter sp.]
MGFLKDLIDDNARDIKKYQKKVEKINQLEPSIQVLSDDELRAKTVEFKERLEQGEMLDDLLPEAFAVVREASKRVLGQRHYDVQLIGGMVLHDGRIAEMKTGEGKTLVATLPTYLNALTGLGVHVVTVNDYLATRDANWMGQVYDFLGLSVGLIVHGLTHEQRRTSYNADITYGTNNEFGFDYLRDNMSVNPAAVVQRELHYAIVDEVDSILIDEARTPLIISGEADKPTELYFRVAKVVPRLKPEEDYHVNEKDRVVTLTENGVSRVETMLGVDNLYDDLHNEVAHHVNQALKAHTLFKLDRDYVVKDGQVIIVDEFTGRLMFGRRYSEGLHQAIEAKENVKIERESQTLATITFQNFFRMFKKLGGMTGTAKTEEQEFINIYRLDVVEVPTNLPMVRQDLPDVIYRTEEGKFNAVVNDISEKNAKGQPVLVGTISIEKSEKLSDMLKKKGVPHQVLNAKFHELEAQIVAKAGEQGMVTIATNMAGRGTDIVLGEGVKELGGLHIIGTERHESRRIDNQLRGRSGRQGDPGSSQFYISLDDDLMRLFGGDNIAGLMDKLGMDDSVPVESKIVSRSIETAQKRVEGRNFDIRKHVLNYDDVMNKQREIIYSQRRSVLTGENLKEQVMDMIEKVIADTTARYSGNSPYPEEWDLVSFLDYVDNVILPDHDFTPEQISNLAKEEVEELLTDRVHELYEIRESQFGSDLMRQIERAVALQVVDTRWKEHLDAMDSLREGIGLRAYGQRDPLLEYKNEAFDMFQGMVESIQEDVSTYILRVTPRITTQVPEQAQKVSENRYEEEQEQVKKPRKIGEHIGRNDPCPCGSGKKYKKCCGINS